MARLLLKSSAAPGLRRLLPNLPSGRPSFLPFVPSFVAFSSLLTFVANAA